MPDRLRLALIFGGRSVEHEVSVVSAQHVIAAVDPARFEIVPIGVTKSGAWLSPRETRANLDRIDPPFKKEMQRRKGGSWIAEQRGRDVLRGGPELRSEEERWSDNLSFLRDVRRLMPTSIDAASVRLLAESVDVAFPLIHGAHGEDGTLQGFLELLDVPYVGCGVAASAIGMDKALMKAVFTAAGLPVAGHVVLEAPRNEAGALRLARDIEEQIGWPAFVKPANGGSSVGISKARDREELASGILVASAHDRKLVIEKAIAGREIECAVLGNDDAQASPAGEVRHRRDFYDYEAKYLDPATEVLAPADLPAETVRRIQSLALRAFHSIDGAGMSRVDFFLLGDDSLIIDEINTIPGFTPASMFPRLWQAAGVSYSELITRLVELALTRHGDVRRFH